jgi:hypothetical protein
MKPVEIVARLDGKTELLTRAAGRNYPVPVEVVSLRGEVGLCCFTATLFVFLATAAWARIVAADFGAGAYRLWSFGLGSPGLILQLLLLAALTLLDLPSFVFGARGLNQEQIANGFAIDPAHHLLEERECFFLEFDEGILLAVTTQSNSLFEVVEAEEVILPLRVDNIQNDAALEPAHHGRAEERFFFLIALTDFFHQRVA